MLLLLTNKTCWFWCKFQIEANDKIVWKNQTVEYEISFDIQVNETMLFRFNKNGPPFFLFTNVHLIIARLFFGWFLSADFTDASHWTGCSLANTASTEGFFQAHCTASLQLLGHHKCIFVKQRRQERLRFCVHPYPYHVSWLYCCTKFSGQCQGKVEPHWWQIGGQGKSLGLVCFVSWL